MSHYEKRLEADLWKIRDSLQTIAQKVEVALKDAVHALLEGNDKISYGIMIGDRPINRAIRRLDKMCHSFIALHLPSAGHLRFISAVMRVSIALERIGDYAVTISRESVHLHRPPRGALAREVEIMAEQSRQMLNKAILAFLGSNTEMALTTMSMTSQVSKVFDTVFDSLVKEEGDWTKKELFAMLVVFNMLLRVSDQAKNLCEETIFAVSGESKSPSEYRILFLDEDNSCFSQIAEAFARKTFGKCGKFFSAGRSAADSLDPNMVKFLEARGIDLSSHKPKAIEDLPHTLGEHYVIVSLQRPVKTYMDEVPFHSIALEWDMGDPPDPAASEDETYGHFERLYREIAHAVSELIEKLRGIKAPCSVI